MTSEKDSSWLEGPGVWSTFADPFVASGLGRLGFAWVAIDQQHGRWDDASTGAALAATTDGATVVARVRANDSGLIGRALDWGARGVIVPMVDTDAQAEATVHAALYPPQGGRSWGPIAGCGSAARAEPVVAVMLETSLAVSNAEAIARVPGVDMLFVGPFDLSLALGTTVDELLGDGSVLRRISAAAAAAGIRAGAFAGTPERARVLRALGFTALAITTDAALLELGAASALHTFTHDS